MYKNSAITLKTFIKLDGDPNAGHQTTEFCEYVTRVL